MHHVSRRVAAALATAALIIGIPMGVALASHQFGDVPNSNPFHGDIDAIADAGITGGCGGGNYCPKANVTREQMAAFMNRLGALAPGKTPVVNATKVDGLSSEHLTPTVLFARAESGALDLSTSPVICETATYTPETDALARISTVMSVQAPGGGSILWGSKAVVSTGGAYTNTAPDWFNATTTAAGEYGVMAGDGVAELTAGTTYKFAVRGARFGGETTATSHICTIVVDISGRVADSGLISGGAAAGGEAESTGINK